MNLQGEERCSIQVLKFKMEILVHTGVSIDFRVTGGVWHCPGNGYKNRQNRNLAKMSVEAQEWIDSNVF